jgi:hypothetical protein
LVDESASGGVPEKQVSANEPFVGRVWQPIEHACRSVQLFCSNRFPDWQL